MKIIEPNEIHKLIKSINESNFYRNIYLLIKKNKAINKVRIFCYNKDSKPYPLGEKKILKIDKEYCDSFYKEDPIHKIIFNCEQDIFLSISNETLRGTEYYKKFYNRLPWEHETSIVFHISMEKKISISIQSKEPIIFSQTELEILKNCIITHEKNNDDHFSNIHLLTHREKEILSKIKEGYNNKEISEELFLSVDTIKNHKKNIYRKLNVKKSTDIIIHKNQNH